MALPITTQLFAEHIKAKMNRIDTSAYADIRFEEVIFFANNAHKSLLLDFESGRYSHKVDADTIAVYLKFWHKLAPGYTPINNVVILPDNTLKVKDVECYIEILDPGSGQVQFSGTVPARLRETVDTYTRAHNPMLETQVDMPVYSIEGTGMTFDPFTNPLASIKTVNIKLLSEPDLITDTTPSINVPYLDELEDKTVTLLLENLDSTRLRTQPMTSRS